MGACICSKQVIKCQKQSLSHLELKANASQSKAKVTLEQDHDIRDSFANLIVDISNLKDQLNSKEKHNYEIITPIGQGSYGTVYKVKNKKTKQIFAMKVIKKEFIRKEEGMIEEKFINEIEILKKTDHPNIIKTYELFQDKRRYYIITEYTSGGDLYDTICKHKSFNEETAAEIMHQLLCAVNYLHSLKIVHRDIKPENILVIPNDNEIYRDADQTDNFHWTIKLIDFGTGGFLLDQTKFSVRVGTPYYRAPEMMNKDYNQKVDIWSCGVILFILLSGCPPFNGKDKKELKESISKGEYSMNTDEWKTIGDNAKDLVKRMLKRNPMNRISAIEALEHPFLNQITEKNKQIYSKDLPKVLSSLKAFNAENKFQQATLAYIVHYLISGEEIQTLKNVFQVLDTNKDGFITYDELKHGLEQVYGNQLTSEQINTIMNNIDHNKNGVIDYEEFLTATLNWNNLISEENLKNAFDRFDSSKNNKLTKNELAQLFASDLNSESRLSVCIDQLIQMVNRNDQLDINYEQFKTIMNQLLQHVNKTTYDQSELIDMNMNQNATNNNDNSINIINYSLC